MKLSTSDEDEKTIRTYLSIKCCRKNILDAIWNVAVKRAWDYSFRPQHKHPDGLIWNGSNCLMTSCLRKNRVWRILPCNGVLTKKRKIQRLPSFLLVQQHISIAKIRDPLEEVAWPKWSRVKWMGVAFVEFAFWNLLGTYTTNLCWHCNFQISHDSNFYRRSASVRIADVQCPPCTISRYLRCLKWIRRFITKHRVVWPYTNTQTGTQSI